MTLYEIASLITPPVFMKILHKCFKNEKSIHYIKKIQKKNPSTINQITKNNEKILVIGNGPSLTKNLENDIEKFKNFDCIVVNHFCESEYYSLIKPKFYLLADPAFFGDIDTYSDWRKNEINKFIDSIVANTQWDINLIIPSIAINSVFLSKILKNSFIHIYIYNNTQNFIRYDESKKIEKFNLWDNNLIVPPAQNCLCTCVWLGIFLRYKEVYIIGADTNYLSKLCVDQKTNTVYINFSHFNEHEKKTTCYIDKEGKKLAKQHELVYNVATTFKEYWELLEYANYAGAKVFNASEFSMIDAFERKKL